MVQLPPKNTKLEKDEEIGSVEGGAGAQPLMAPVSGTVTDVNELLESDPEVLGEKAESEGWIAKIKMSDEKELDGLMDADTYKKAMEHY